MAGGWTRDGAVQEQIDDTVKDAVLRAVPIRRSEPGIRLGLRARCGVETGVGSSIKLAFSPD